jgi:hypothetical protein
MKKIPVLEYSETIKDIPGYEGLYAVTSFGRVWSYPKSWDTCRGAKSHDGRWLSPSLSKYGSLVTKFSNNYFSVAQLVALTYIPNPDNFKIVSHIDKNQLNNHVSNLLWTTKSAQIKDDIYKHNKTHGQRPKRIQASTGESFNCMRDAAIWCGLTAHTVIMRHLNKNIVRGKYLYKSAGKHPITKEPLTWRYLD